MNIVTVDLVLKDKLIMSVPLLSDRKLSEDEEENLKLVIKASAYVVAENAGEEKPEGSVAQIHYTMDAVTVDDVLIEFEKAKIE